MFDLLLSRSTNLQPEKPSTDGQDLLSFALDGGHPEIIKTVEQRLPTVREWTTSTRRAGKRIAFTANSDEKSGDLRDEPGWLRSRSHNSQHSYRRNAALVAGWFKILFCSDRDGKFAIYEIDLTNLS